MNNYKTPKGIIRNDERRVGLVKIVKAITTTAGDFVKIKYEAIIKRIEALVNGVNDITIGAIDLTIAENNYTIEDNKELEEKKEED